jgi:hypothetical protein
MSVVGTWSIKIIFMHALKKPFTLLLILSHLNAFVLGVGGMGNVYAANQVVDTTKSRIISAF